MAKKAAAKKVAKPSGRTPRKENYQKARMTAVVDRLKQLSANVNGLIDRLGQSNSGIASVVSRASEDLNGVNETLEQTTRRFAGISQLRAEPRMSMTMSQRVPTTSRHRSTQCPAIFFLSRMMTRSTSGAERKNGAGGRPQATVIRAPGTCRAISRITPEDMTQSPMRLEVTNRTFLAVLVSVTRFWPSLRFPGFAISP